MTVFSRLIGGDLFSAVETNYPLDMCRSLGASYKIGAIHHQEIQPEEATTSTTQEIPSIIGRLFNGILRAHRPASVVHVATFGVEVLVGGMRIDTFTAQVVTMRVSRRRGFAVCPDGAVIRQ